MARDAGSGRRVAGVGLAVLALNLLGFLGLAALSGLGPPFWGIGILAYLLGARHAFDIDHIAAIDNVTRRLRHEGRRPAAVGLFFSLGHSTVVVLATAALLLGGEHFRALLPALRGWGAVLGAGISATFLILIGTANIGIVRRLWQARGEHEDAARAREVEALLQQRGGISRVMRFAFRRIDKSHKMYVVGLLFGLGFDTASEIILLALTAAAMRQYGLDPWLLLALPLLFAAGMTLMDSACGLGMLRLYDWSINGGRRTWFVNIGITGLSTLLAFGVGAVELSASFHWPVASALAAVLGMGCVLAGFAALRQPARRHVGTGRLFR
ncbi:MAG TPA: HoxN/HupN/NixA family nickel/cobalt transporter [Gammaproteobacteria bacterium]|nr:HoxN/HupN/NixA family nickel/cobalt transporter [Gammaproteobacteria bacterium]